MNKSGNHMDVLNSCKQLFKRLWRGPAVFGALVKEIALRKKTEEDLSDILESITDGFFAVDKNWVIKYWNKEAERLLGMAREKMLNKNLWEIYQEATRLKFYTEYYRVMNERVSVSFDEYFPPLQRWFEVNAYPSREGISVFFKDITDKKTASEELRIAKERYDLVAKATNDAIWDWDVLEDKVYWGEGLKASFGYNYDEEPRMLESWIRHIHPDYTKAIVDSLMHAVFETNDLKWEKEYCYYKADGTTAWVLDRGFVIRNEMGKPLRMIGALQDITYRKEEEKKLKLQEIKQEQEITKAIIKAQEQERFQIGAELHDNVNQLLATAQLTLGMSKKDAGPSSEEWVERTRTYIGQAISEIRRLSHNLAPATLEDISLKDAFEILLDSINLSNKYKIALHFDPFNPSYKINSDIQINLYRILQEQLKNITKYADATTIDISVKMDEKNVEMKIVDNGKGFDKAKVKTGIGLNNMQKRAELFFGSFILNTAPGHGCEIIVKMPLDL